MHQRHDKGIPQTLDRHHSPVDEVTLPKRICVPFQKVIPGVGTSTRSGIVTVLFEDSLHRGFRNRPDAKLLQFPEDSSITPVILPGKPQHQPANLLRCPTSASPDRKSRSTQ